MNQAFIFLAAIILISSCTATRYVEPLEKNKQAVGFNFGGALIEYSGLTIPIPLTAVSYARGLSDNLTVFGSLHLTSMYYKNFQTDLGVTYKLLEQNKYIPALSVTPSINFIKHKGEGNSNLWPSIDLNGYWNYGKKNHYFYLGIMNWFELSKIRAHNEPSLRRVLWNPQVGHVFKLGTFQLATELKFLAPYEKTDFIFIPYKGIFGSNGATGVFINLSKTF